MELFILRHGSAHPDAVKDSERALNATGREAVEQILRENAQRLEGINHVLVSPYLRAQQTCEIALRFLPKIPAKNVHTVDCLVPTASPKSVIEHLSERGFSSVLCVSHQPLLGTLLDEICDFEPGQYRLATGALAQIHFDDLVAKGLGKLRWLKQP